MIVDIFFYVQDQTQLFLPFLVLFSQLTQLCSALSVLVVSMGDKGDQLSHQLRSVAAVLVHSWW